MVQVNGEAESILVDLVLVVHPTVPHGKAFHELSRKARHGDPAQRQEEVVRGDPVPRHDPHILGHHGAVAFWYGFLEHNSGLNHPPNQQIGVLTKAGNHLVSQVRPRWLNEKADLSLKLPLKVAHPPVVARRTNLSGAEILRRHGAMRLRSGSTAENGWLKLVAANGHPL
jgi:hypothetical protein